MANILIVDDSPTEVLLFQQIMQTLGHDTVVARDGEDAERILADHVPDLVLLDVVMPKKDGYQVCRTIKENPTLKQAKIIFVSTRNQESDRLLGNEAGRGRLFRKTLRCIRTCG